MCGNTACATWITPQADINYINIAAGSRLSTSRGGKAGVVEEDVNPAKVVEHGWTASDLGLLVTSSGI